MNYIELINQFWSTRRRVRLTSSEADLYFCLMQECNLRGWANPFECPNGLICALITIDEMTLSRARNGLQQKGLIEFDKGQRKAKSPTYTLLYPNFEGISVGKIVSKTEGISVGKTVSKTGATPIIGDKLNKTKVSITSNPPSGDAELPLKIDLTERQEPERDVVFCDRVMEKYRECCKGLPPIKTMTPKRRKSIMARKREHKETAIFDMLETAGRSDFLAGQNNNQWTADFDWLFKPNNFVKILEHKYDNKKQSINGSASAGGDQRTSIPSEYNEGF